MVKKLRCEVDGADWVLAESGGHYVEICMHSGELGGITNIFLSPKNAKKLRKQIKVALDEIEDEPAEDIVDEKEEPAYIPHVGEVVEVYRNTEGHRFDIGERVRIVELEDDGTIRAEHLDGSDYWWVNTDIRPIQNWKPKEGERVLIVDSTFSPCPGSKNFIGKFGYIKGFAAAILVDNEDRSDWFGFNLSDLRPAE